MPAAMQSPSIRQPRTVEAATALCERYTELEGQIAVIQEQRQAAIAAENARADTAANDLIAQRDAIAAKLEPWFLKAKDELLTGKAKSVELGGVILAIRKARPTLQIEGDEKSIIERLREFRWAKSLIRQRASLDRPQILKELGGLRGDELSKLGLTRDDGEDAFSIKRAEQTRTRASS